jgi:hypothetical protein
MTVRDGKAVLAPTNPKDEYQHWIKDMRWSMSEGPRVVSGTINFLLLANMHVRHARVSKTILAT